MAIAIGAVCALMSACEMTPPAMNPPMYEGYELAWSDEFNDKEIGDAWRFDIDSPAYRGWGNSELQVYTDDNASIRNGHLIIETRHKNGRYTSARMHTHGGKSFRYGIIAARILLPSNRGDPDGGIWAALWTLGDNFNGWGHSYYGGDTGWPASGEIDIMELFGRNINARRETSGALHWQTRRCAYVSYATEHCSTSASVAPAGNIYGEFHIYGIEWNEERIRWFVDDRLVLSQDITDSEFDAFRLPHFVLLNVSVGGNPVGIPNPANYPQKMYVDWVAHYQCAREQCEIALVK